MRQIWIFFASGLGGDGLANLLELANDVQVWGRDPQQPVWRVHRIVDDEVKFWAPPVDTQHCFRTGRWFDQQHNQLNGEYVEAISRDRDVIVTSHDILLYNLDKSDRQDLLCRNQIKVLLDSRNYFWCYQRSIKKNLRSLAVTELDDCVTAKHNPNYLRYGQVDRSRFDHVIWLEDITDYNGLHSLLYSLNLTIDPHLITQYQQLRQGQWREILAPTQRPPCYESYILDGWIHYKALDYQVDH